MFRRIWQKGLYPWWKWSERSQNRIPKQGMNLRHIRTGLDFSEDFWINREVSDSRTNVNQFVSEWAALCVFDSKRTGSRAACTCNHRALFSERFVATPCHPGRYAPEWFRVGNIIQCSIAFMRHHWNVSRQLTVQNTHTHLKCNETLTVNMHQFERHCAHE